MDYQRTVLDLKLRCLQKRNLCQIIDHADQNILFEGSFRKSQKFLVEELENRHGSGQPNLPLWTLGGRQFWADEYFYAGWRIQQNIYTNHYRLLDPDNVRQAWGDYEACRTAFEKIRVNKDISAGSSHLVIIVHGLFRSRFHMSVITETIKEAGFEPAAIDYPSTGRALADHARQLKKIIRRYDGADTVSFVTHSMGGLVVRSLFKEESWKKNIIPHRLVMIAPPNQGAEVARQFQNVPFYRQVTGPSGEQLVEEAKTLPVPDIEFGIIAGKLDSPIGFSSIIEGKNDGLVAVENTRLKGSSAFKIISGDHNSLPHLEKTQNLVLDFLAEGRFQ